MQESIQSIPAAADKEDFWSRGMNTEIKNFKILDKAYGILGIELMLLLKLLISESTLFAMAVKKQKRLFVNMWIFLISTDHYTPIIPI